MLKYFGIVFMALVLAACGQVTPFEVGEQEYVSGNYLNAARVFAQHTAWNSDIKYEAMYYEGMCWFNLQSYDKAIKLFTNVIEHSGNRLIKAKAIAAKADVCLLQGDCAGAISLYKMLLLAGYIDYYPQAEAYKLLKKAALQCGTEEVLAEYEGFESIDITEQDTVVGGLMRVRLETRFTDKTEALAAMQTLASAGVDSSLIRITDPAGEYFSVQAGAFSNPDNANFLAQRLFELGWKAVIVE